MREPDVSADRRSVRGAAGVAPRRGLLRAFNDVGVLAAADVHVAARLAELVGEESEAVLLALALAVRGPRLGHVFVDLATIRDTASVESDEPVDLSALPWPSVDDWVGALSRRARWSRWARTTARLRSALGARLYSTATGARSAGVPSTRSLARGALGRRRV